MNYKYTKTPEDFAAFFFAENKITHPEFEYIIHLGFPRFLLKWKASEGQFADFEDFFDGIVELQWLDGVAPSESEKQKLLIQAWNYLAIEDRILEDDMENWNDD